MIFKCCLLVMSENMICPVVWKYHILASVAENIIFSTAACWSGLKIWYFVYVLSVVQKYHILVSVAACCLKISYFGHCCCLLLKISYFHHPYSLPPPSLPLPPEFGCSSPQQIFDFVHGKKTMFFCHFLKHPRRPPYLRLKFCSQYLMRQKICLLGGLDAEKQLRKVFFCHFLKNPRWQIFVVVDMCIHSWPDGPDAIIYLGSILSVSSAELSWEHTSRQNFLLLSRPGQSARAWRKLAIPTWGLLKDNSVFSYS